MVHGDLKVPLNETFKSRLKCSPPGPIATPPCLPRTWPKQAPGIDLGISWIEQQIAMFELQGHHIKSCYREIKHICVHTCVYIYIYTNMYIYIYTCGIQWYSYHRQTVGWPSGLWVAQKCLSQRGQWWNQDSPCDLCLQSGANVSLLLDISGNLFSEKNPQ